MQMQKRYAAIATPSKIIRGYINRIIKNRSVAYKMSPPNSFIIAG
jgi:hypothetical protein